MAEHQNGEVCRYHQEFHDLAQGMANDFLWTGRIVKAILAILCSLLAVVYSASIRLSDSLSDMTLLAKSNAQHISVLYERDKESVDRDKVLQQSIKELWSRYGELSKK